MTHPRTQSFTKCRRRYRRPGIESLEHRRVLASYIVTTPLDTLDSNDGLLSLREAVIAANQNSDQEDFIRFSPDIRGETIRLTIPFVQADTPETGDLDITVGTISVIGFDRESSILDLAALDHRAFQISNGATLNLSGMTILNGNALFGGAIRVDDGGHLELDDVLLTDNTAEVEGGAIFVDAGATATVFDSGITRNNAVRGGAVALRGSLETSGIQFLGNKASDRGGAIAAFDAGADLTVYSSAFVNNEAGGGSAIVSDGATSYVANATFASNRSIWGGTVLNRGEGDSMAFLQVLQSTFVDDLSDQVGPLHSAARDNANVKTEVGNTIIHNTNGPRSITTFVESGSATVDVLSLGNNLLFDDGGGFAVPSDLVDVDTLSDPFMDSRVRHRGGNVWVYEVFGNSPSIDAGNSSLITNHERFDFLFDQRGVGFDRIHGGQVDIGAMEYQVFSEDDMVVTSLADQTDPNDGMLTLREALERANAQAGHDTVRFAEGLFTGGAGRIELREESLPIRHAVTVLGPGSDLLVIDGLTDTRIFDIWFGDFDVELSALTLAGGVTFAGNPSLDRDEPLHNFENSGPAIRSFSDGTLTLSSVQVVENATRGDAAHGAVAVLSGNLTVLSSIFRDNETLGYQALGGAIYSGEGHLRIENSTFEANRTSGVNSHGGAVFVEQGETEIRDTVFAANSVSGDFAQGGAIKVQGDSVFTRVQINGNTTAGRNGFGGGLFAERGEITLADSVVSNNRTTGSASHGGGIASSSPIALLSTEVKDNALLNGSSRGGGIAFVSFEQEAHLTLDRSVLSDNDASTGADLWVENLGGESLELQIQLIDEQGLYLADVANWRMTAPIEVDGGFRLTAQHVDSALTSLTIETDTPWRNPLQPSDVNNDGDVSALDALLVINQLNRTGSNTNGTSGLPSPDAATWANLYYDQNGDGQASALDALRVINDLNRRGNGSSESEQRSKPILIADIAQQRFYDRREDDLVWISFTEVFFPDT